MTTGYVPKPKAPGCRVLTVGENALYWRKWAKVKSMLALGKFTREEIDAKRREIHEEALGRQLSHKDFTHEELDRVLDAFDAYLIDADPRKARRAVEQPRKRARFAIEDLADQLMITRAELDAIARQHFSQLSDNWETWSASDLHKLRLHLVSKVRAAQARAAHATM